MVKTKKGILDTPERTEKILRQIKEHFRNGKINKLAADLTKLADANAPAIVSMHRNMAIANGHCHNVSNKDMPRVEEIVKNAEVAHIAKQKALAASHQR